MGSETYDMRSTIHPSLFVSMCSTFRYHYLESQAPLSPECHECNKREPSSQSYRPLPLLVCARPFGACFCARDRMLK
jgi:hypothetical protein